MNTEILRSFIIKKDHRNICVTKNEEDNLDQFKTYFLETIPEIKPFATSTIAFIKKADFLDCNDKKKLKKDLQILNFSGEKNETCAISQIQNCIKTVFNPLVNSYRLSLSEDRIPNIKLLNSTDVQNKMSELLGLLNQVQTNIKIDLIKLSMDPEIKEKIDAIITEQENILKSQNHSVQYTELASENIISNLNYKDIMEICDNIAEWSVDISKIKKKEKNIKEGDVLNEKNYWKEYGNVLNEIKKELQQPHVQMTLSICKKLRPYIAKPFERNTYVDELIKRTESYNVLLKGLPIEALRDTKTIPEVNEQIKNIFEHLKNKIKISIYPIQRLFNLVEIISVELNNRLFQILNDNILLLKYEDFIYIYKQLKTLFKEIWIPQYESLQKEIENLPKQRRDGISNNTIPTKFQHYELEDRLKDIKHFRVEHKNLMDMTYYLENKNGNDKDQESALAIKINIAYQKVINVQALNCSTEGKAKWEEAKNEYNKVIEDRMINALVDKLASAQSSAERFKIIDRFNFIIKNERVQTAKQEYKENLINDILKILTNMKEKIKNGYEKSSALNLCRIRGIPKISGKIIWMRQLVDKADEYKMKMKIILGDEWEQTEDRRKINELIKDINDVADNADIIIDEFCIDSNDISENNMEDNDDELVLCVEGNPDNLKLNVNFSEKKQTGFIDCRLIQYYSSKIPEIVISKNYKNKTIYSYAINLLEAFRSFNSCCQKIKKESKITKLIAGKKMKFIN